MVEGGHHLFSPTHTRIPFLRNDFFKIWPWKSKFKVMGEVNVESHNMLSNILSIHAFSVPCHATIPFLRYDFFKIWPWKSKVNVMVEVEVESHKVGVASYRLTSISFHVNQPFHSWHTKFSRFDLENPRLKWNDNDVAQLQV